MEKQRQKDEAYNFGRAVDWEEKYGVGEVLGKKGIYRQLPKGLLKVDHLYQRRELGLLQHKIALNFNWNDFSVLCVSLRKNGEYYIIDGQQRLGAALKRSSLSSLPCLVFENLTIIDEAKMFSAINGVKRLTGSIDRFRADIISGEPEALKIKEILELTGQHISNTNSKDLDSVRCISTIKRFFKIMPKKFEVNWPFISRASGRPPHQDIIKGLFYLVYNNVSIDDEKEKILSVGPLGIRAEINKVGLETGISKSEKLCGLGILSIMNKGKKTNKYSLLPK